MCLPPRKACRDSWYRLFGVRQLFVPTLAMFVNCFKAIISVGTCFASFYWATSTWILPTFLAVCQVGISFFYRRTADQLVALHGAPQNKLTKLVADTGNGAECIYAFGWQNAFLEKFHVILAELYHSRHEGARLGQWSATTSHGTTAAAAIAIVTIVLRSEQPPSQIAVGFVFVALMAFAFQINWLAICFSASDSALAGAQQIRAFLESTPQEIDPEEYSDVPLEWPQQGQIRLNCVTAQYRCVIHLQTGENKLTEAWSVIDLLVVFGTQRWTMCRLRSNLVRLSAFQAALEGKLIIVIN